MRATRPESTRARWGASYTASLLLHVSGGAALLLLGLAPLARSRAATRAEEPTIVIEPPYLVEVEPLDAPPEQEWEVSDAPPVEEAQVIHEELEAPVPDLEPLCEEPPAEDLLRDDPFADVSVTLVLRPQPPEPQPPEPEPTEPAVTAPPVATPPPAAPLVFHTSPIPLAAHSAPPSYPDRAWRLGFEGTVVLRVTVGVDGQVVEITVDESSGHAVLDKAAVRALKSWRFVPGKRGDEPVEMDWIKRLQFRLE